MELVLKSLSAHEVHLANTSVLQLGGFGFLGWLVVLCGIFGILCQCKNVTWLHIYKHRAGEKKMVSNSSGGNQVHTQGSLQSVTTTNCNSMQTARKGYIIFVGERITEP